jgi:hypothetical protein
MICVKKDSQTFLGGVMKNWRAVDASVQKLPFPKTSMSKLGKQYNFLLQYRYSIPLTFILLGWVFKF